jgi:hypothetical protein
MTKTSFFQPLFSVADLSSRLRNTDGRQPSLADARRRSVATSMKEKNVIVILAIIAIVFAACNIPQAVCRIMNVPSRAKDVPFQVGSIELRAMDLHL